MKISRTRVAVSTTLAAIALIVSIVVPDDPVTTASVPRTDRVEIGSTVDTYRLPSRGGADLSAEPTVSGDVFSRLSTTSASARPEDLSGTITPVDWITVMYPDLGKLRQLADEDADTALAALHGYLYSEELPVRLAALEAMADIERAEKLPTLLGLLQDSDPDIRIAALEALILHGDRSAAPSVEALAYDPDRQVRLVAIDTLAALGDSGSVHLLAGLLADSNRDIRNAAVAALAEIGGETALGHLQQSRFDPDESIQASANAIFFEESTAPSFQQ